MSKKTALTLWDAYSSLGGYLPSEEAIIEIAEAAIIELKTENKRLKCCGNCNMRNVDECDAYTQTGTMYVVPDDSCHFTPSRWEARP